MGKGRKVKSISKVKKIEWTAVHRIFYVKNEEGNLKQKTKKVFQDKLGYGLEADSVKEIEKLIDQRKATDAV